MLLTSTHRFLERRIGFHGRGSVSKTVRIGAFVAVASVLAAACVSANTPPLPAPPEVSVLPTTTSIPDFSGTSIPRAAGTTTTAAPGLTGGSSTIRGRTLNGAGEPLGGATVRIERFVGDQVASADVVSAPDGTFGLSNALGGRYRVRAFRPPDMTMTQAQVIFLGAGESRSLDLKLDRFGDQITVTAAIAPDPPELGDPANLVVFVSSKGVDGSGLARSFGSPSVPVVLSSAGGRAIVTPNPTVTDGAGRARWTIVCVALERQQLAVILPDGSQHPLDLSPCRLPATTTTDAPSLVPLP